MADPMYIAYMVRQAKCVETQVAHFVCFNPCTLSKPRRLDEMLGATR